MHPQAKKIPMTPQGFADLQREQKELLASRPAAVEELKRAREMGDLSENGAYKSAKMLVGHIDSRLRHLAYLIRFAKIETPSKVKEVSIGSIVLVSDGTGERQFSIVGEHEASPMEGKISHNSPIGRSLMGRKENEQVAVGTPSGIVTYTILKIGLD